MAVAHQAIIGPRGAYWRSIASVAPASPSPLQWQWARPSNEAGLGLFAIWCALVAPTTLAALVASLAAAARYLSDAASARA